MELIRWRVTWTDPDGQLQTYESALTDLAGEADAYVRARAVLERQEPGRDVVVAFWTETRSSGPVTSSRVDLSVVGPALERIKRTARLIPSVVGGPPIREMRDGSQEYGPYPGLGQHEPVTREAIDG
jgi:hypothetical protein